MQELVEQVINCLRDKKIQSFEVSFQDQYLKIVKRGVLGRGETESSPVLPSGTPTTAPTQLVIQETPEAKPDSAKTIEIRSKYIGFFHRQQPRDEQPIVKVGDAVVGGQILGYVRAMNIFHDVRTELVGTVAEILVEEGRAVEYDKPLFILNIAE